MAAASLMLIEFVRSGGFANVPLRLTLDTDSLDPAQRDEWTARVDAADFFRLPRRLSTPAMADPFNYHVRILRDGREHTVDIVGQPPSQAVQDLLDYLTAAAKHARKK